MNLAGSHDLTFIGTCSSTREDTCTIYSYNPQQVVFNTVPPHPVFEWWGLRMSCLVNFYATELYYYYSYFFFFNCHFIHPVKGLSHTSTYIKSRGFNPQIYISIFTYIFYPHRQAIILTLLNCKFTIQTVFISNCVRYKAHLCNLH